MKPNGTTWRRSRIKALLSSQEAADALGVAQKSLLNIESNQPNATASDLLTARAAALYGVPVETLIAEAANDGVPDEPPDQAPQGPTKPPPQRKEKAGGGPKRPGGNAQRGAA